MDRQQKESLNVFKLTTDQLEFLRRVANIVQSAAMRRNSNLVPMQMNLTECNKTNGKLSVGDAEGLSTLKLSVDSVQTAHSVTLEIQPLLQLQVSKSRYHRAKFAATLGLSEELSKALREAAVSRSLNYVIPMRFPRRFTIDLIGQRPAFGNVEITDGRSPGFRQSNSAEIVLDSQQLQSTDRVQTADSVTVEIQPVLQLQVSKRRYHRVKFAATLELSEALSKALRAVAVSRSLNYVILVRFPRHFTIDLIGQRPAVGNVEITDGRAPGFRQSNSADIVLDSQQLQSTDRVQTADIVTAEIRPAVLPTLICPRQTDDDILEDENVDRPEAATAVRRRRRILSALGRRLLKVGRMLCCWCSTVPSEDTE
ncbi:unnamed protein product [Macrosiphum euphorbiae]|uniref:Uncharacterized protein n=1 Tax=Macrosiphum euphorbiae TaxID=13131 RepID=A0AAV0VW35_9HEMI|nr:unnamed protein product [Macrosiphum euphorbiae]